MSLRNAFGNLALDATVQSVYTWLQARLGAKTTANSVSVNIANDQTVPVSAANLPLPSGASTAANQTTANTSLSSIDSKLPALSSGRLPVDVGTSINVGEVEIKNDTGNPVPVSAASLPLPSGAATSANQSTANTSLASIDTKIPVLVSGRQPVDGSGVTQPVSDASGSLTVDGKAYRAAVTITRPSNTTAYTVGDVVGDTSGSAIITLSSIAPSAGHVIIQSVSLLFSDASVPSGMAAFRVHFYSASPTAIADNAVFDLASGERANYLGYVDLPTPSDLGSSLYTQTDYCGRLVKLASASTSLFAEIETRGAYTPASASTVLLTVNTLEAGL